MGTGEESTIVAGDRVQSSPSHDDTLLAPDSVGTGRDRPPFEGIPRPDDIEEIAHYKVLERIGEGGMGLIFAAEDQKLQRKIAVKLVRAMHGDRQSAQARLMREAQALAQVNHPNVIHVYEVGTFGDQVFVAMEYVDGETLRSWQWREHISWRAILDAYLAAGRGLAAAHAKGLVHRDFKPDNVLITRDRKVRVIDFGLARAEENEVRLDLDDSLAKRKTDLRQPLTRLTETGTLMGTPAYMAPEQHTGDATDHRTDQFAFCVALYEALYGMRPFAGDTYAELVGKVLRGEVEDEPRFVRVPPATRKVLLRGLSTAPDKRYPNMEALLAELRRDPRAWIRRAPWIAGAVASVALVFLGWWTVRSAFDRAGEAADVRAELASRRVAQLESSHTQSAQLRNRLVLGRARELVARDPTTAVSLLRLLDADLPPGPSAAAIIREGLRRGIRTRVVAPPPGHSFGNLAGSENGRRFVASAGPNLLVMDATGTVLETRALPFVPEALDVTTEPGLAVVAHGDAAVLLALGQPAATERTIPTNAGSRVTAIAFAPDGRTVALGFESGVIELWSTTSDEGAPRGRLVDQHAAVRSLDFNDAGSVVVSGGDDGGVFRWDLASNKHRSTNLEARTITAVRSSGAHDVLLLDSRGDLSSWLSKVDGKTKLARDVAVAEPRGQGWFALGPDGRGKGSTPAQFRSKPRAMAVGPSGRVVILDAQGQLEFWTQEDEDIHVVPDHGAAPVFVAMAQGNRFVTASTSGVVSVVQLDPLRVTEQRQMNGTLSSLATDAGGSTAAVTRDGDGLNGDPTVLVLELTGTALGEVSSSSTWPAALEDLHWAGEELVRLSCPPTGCGIELSSAKSNRRVDVELGRVDARPSLRSSPDGRWLRATGGRRTVLVDRAAGVGIELDWLGPRPEQVLASDFGRRVDGAFRAMTCTNETNDSGTGRIGVWQRAPDSPRMHVVEGFEAEGLWVDERRSGLVFRDEDGVLHAWPLSRPAPTRLPFEADQVSRVVFGPEARHVAIEVGGVDPGLWVVGLDGTGFAHYPAPGALWFLVQNGVVAEYRASQLVLRGLEGDLSARGLQKRLTDLVVDPPSLDDLLPTLDEG